MVVVTVMLTVAVFAPVPVTTYVHVPAAIGATLNGPAPLVGLTDAIPAQLEELNAKPPLLLDCAAVTACVGTPGPAAKNESAFGLTITAPAPVAGVGDEIGVPEPVGVAVGASPIGVGELGDGAETLLPPPPHATSISSAAPTSGARNAMGVEDAGRRAGLTGRSSSDIGIV